MRRKILAATLAVAASLGLAAAGTPAHAKPHQHVTPHGVPQLQGGVSILSAAYKYAGGQETPAASKPGIAFNIYIASPAVVSGDHSLMETTVQAGNSGYRQAIVEFGWVKDSPTGNPKLFGSIWVNNSWCGSYTGAGSCGSFYDPNGATGPNLGDSLSGVVGTAKQFITYYDSGTACNGGTGWWLMYNSTNVGCFPTTIWSSASPSYSFTAGEFFQAFGEVYSASGTSCTDMGTGLQGSAKAAGTAYFGSGDYPNDPAVTNMPWTTQTNPTEYSTGYLSGRSAYVGGPGPC